MTAIWLVSIGIGLLFLARGAFQPYIFPLFENLGGLSYARIALLLNGYILAQSVCAPVAGWFTDRTSVRVALTTSIGFGLSSFLIISTSPGFLISAIAVFFAGLAFVHSGGASVGDRRFSRCAVCDGVDQRLIALAIPDERESDGKIGRPPRPHVAARFEPRDRVAGA